MTVMSPVLSPEIEASQPKIYDTANDKRNRFRCLMPIVGEQLASFCELAVCQIPFSIQAVECLEEMGNRLNSVFDKNDWGKDFYLEENFLIGSLIKSLKFFKDGPMRVATPGDLTYINFRLKELVKLLD